MQPPSALAAIVDADADGVIVPAVRFRNPCDLGVARVRCSSVGFESEPAEHLLSRRPSRILTDGKPDSRPWVEVEFSTVSVRPTAYSLAHYSTDYEGDDYHCLRSWRLLAFEAQSREWVALSEHDNECALKQKRA